MLIIKFDKLALKKDVSNRLILIKISDMKSSKEPQTNGQEAVEADFNNLIGTIDEIELHYLMTFGQMKNELIKLKQITKEYKSDLDLTRLVIIHFCQLL